MKIIIETNVFISGVFFSGPPYDILKAWHDGKVQLVVSNEILEEYKRVAETLAKEFPGIDASTILYLLTIMAEVITAPSLPESVCDDPEDDKFVACELASTAKYIISGDKHLLKVSGYHGVKVIRPRVFVDSYLEENKEK